LAETEESSELRGGGGAVKYFPELWDLVGVLLAAVAVGLVIERIGQQ